MKKELTFYQPITTNYRNYINKKVVSYDTTLKDTKVEISKDGSIHITYIDAGTSGHNGDSYDEHDYGWLTYNKAKAQLIRIEKERHKKEIAYLKGLKEQK